MDHDTFVFALDISHRLAEICTLSSMLEAPGSTAVDHRRIRVQCDALMTLGDMSTSEIGRVVDLFYTSAARKGIAKMIGDRLETYAKRLSLPDWGDDVTDAVAALVALLDPDYRPE